MQRALMPSATSGSRAVHLSQGNQSLRPQFGTQEAISRTVLDNPVSNHVIEERHIASVGQMRLSNATLTFR
jgi:hypothetical protein